METRQDLVAATRAELLARLIYGEPANQDARRAHEQVERVAQAVGSHRQRAIVWLHHVLKHEAVTQPIPVALGFDSWLVEAADALGVRPRESLREYGKRVAACSDADVLAVALIAIDDQISEGIVDPQDTPAAYKRARRVLKRAADALANQQPGDTPPAGGVVDNLPTAPALRNALEALVDHSNGAQAAIMEMMRGPGDVPWEVSERLASVLRPKLLCSSERLTPAVYLSIRADPHGVALGLLRTDLRFGTLARIWHCSSPACTT